MDAIVEGEIVVIDGRIAAIGDCAGDYRDLPIVRYAASDYIIPGFIDIHVHGSHGADVMDGDVDALALMSRSLYHQGVTGFLATTMCAPDQTLETALMAIDHFCQKSYPDSADILGIHLEGPFISPHKMGAQHPDYAQHADTDKLLYWQRLSGSRIKKLTMAPEIENARSLIATCHKQGIIGSIGHTSCTAKAALDAINLGMTQATHLFNAMTGVDHRNPGAVAAILMSREVYAELIVDGVHLAPEIVDMCYNLKGSDKTILVTDAMRAQGMGDGVFDLGGQKVIVRGNEARLENGTLAGSVLSMNKALVNMLKFSHCSLNDVIKMTSTNAAETLGLKKGKITPGYDADLVVLNGDFELKQVFRRG